MPLKSYRFDIPVQMIEAIFGGLNELPRKFSQPVIEMLLVQMQAQEAATPPAPPIQPPPPAPPTPPRALTPALFSARR